MVDLEFPDLADDTAEPRDPLSVEINLLSIIGTEIFDTKVSR